MKPESHSPQPPKAKVVSPVLSQLWKDIKRYKSLYCKVLCITFILSVIITLSIPNYYKCTVKLAPELSAGSGGGSLANLANSLGVNIGNASNGADALAPYLYPDLMNSVTFRTSLFSILVKNEETDSIMTYYNYLLNEQRYPWWTVIAKAITNVIKSLLLEEESASGVDPFKLTKEQYKVVKQISEKVVCDVDIKTQVISINVTDYNPLISATIADSIQIRLQTFITDYRTRKARVDLEYNQKLFRESKERYEHARKEYAKFADANQKVFLEKARSEQAELENEMQLQFRSYSQVMAQLQLAEAKVQENTPAFTILQPATVPIEKLGPRRTILCIMLLFLSAFCTTLYVIYKEGVQIIPFYMDVNQL